MRMPAPHLMAVWRFVTQQQRPVMVGDVIRDPVSLAALVDAHDSAANALRKLAARHLLVSDGDDCNPTFWFSQGCIAPPGEQRPIPAVCPRVAGPRTCAVMRPSTVRTPATTS